MRRKLILPVIALMLCASVGVFAAEKRSPTASWLASFNGPGALDLTLTAGFTWWGFGLNAGLEYTVGQFALGTVPLSWGLTAQGSTGFDASGVGLSAAGLATLNIGFDFGRSLKFEAFLGFGPGMVLETWGGGGLGVGISEHGGGTWWFSDSIGLTLEEGWVWPFGWTRSSWYFAGIGVTLKI